MTTTTTRRPITAKPLLTGNMPFARAGVWVCGAVPAALLAWDAINGDLGPDPVKYAIHTTGLLAVILLLSSLAVTPVRVVMGWPWLVQFRRALGVYGFAYAAVHLGIYFAFDRQGQLGSTIYEITHRPYLMIGFISLTLMAPLAATSLNAAIRAIGGKRWRALHRLAYPAAVLACTHYYMQVKADVRNPLIAAAILAVLLAYRVFEAVRKRV